MNKEKLPHEVRSFLDAIENHPDMVYRIFGSLEDLGISDTSEYAYERLMYFAYLRAMMGANQYPLKSTQSYLLKPLPEKDRDNMDLTYTVILDISSKHFNCTDEYFGSNMTVVDDFDTESEKYSYFREIKIYSEKMGSTYDWHIPIFIKIGRMHCIEQVAIPRHRTLFGFDMPIYVVTHNKTLIVSFKNMVCGVYVEVNATNLFRYCFISDKDVVLHKASSHLEDAGEFSDIAKGLKNPIVIEAGYNCKPDSVIVRLFPADRTRLYNTREEHRKGRT